MAKDKDLEEIKKEHKKEEKKEENSGFKETLHHIKEDERVEKIYNFARSNTQDTIAYVVLFVGIILLFFKPEWGGILVGSVGGFYFSNEIIALVEGANTFIDREGLIRSLILGGLLLALIIKATWIIIGVVLGAGLKKLLSSNKVG